MRRSEVNFPKEKLVQVATPIDTVQLRYSGPWVWRKKLDMALTILSWELLCSMEGLKTRISLMPHALRYPV